MNQLINRYILRSSYLPYYIIIIGSILFWYNLVFSGDTIFFDLTTRYFYPMASFLSESIRRFELPLWNPYIFCGMPFLANPQSAVFYPFSYLFVIFNFPAALNIFIVMHTIIAGIFMYILAKHFNMKLAGALCASFLFMFNGFFVLHTEFLSNIACYVWLPAELYYLSKYVETKRYVYALSASLALLVQYFAGHTGYFYYSLLYLCLYYLVFVFDYHNIGTSLKESFRVLLAVSSVTILLSAIQLLPAIELAFGSTRSTGLNIATGTTYSIKPIDFIMFLLIPLWDYLKPFFAGDIHIIGFYTGIISVIIILLNTFHVKTKMHAFLLVSTIVFSLLALGKYFPLFSIFYRIVPGWKYFGFPGQIMFLTMFSMSLLIGLSIDSCHNAKIRCLLIALILIELFTFNIKANRFINKSYYSILTPNLEYLLKDSSLYRIILTPQTYSEPPEYADNYFKRWLNFKDMLYPNTASAYKLFYADGNETLKQGRTFELISSIKAPSSKILSIMNTKYILSKWPLNGDDMKLVKDGYIKIYENKNAMPRFYFANNAQYLHNSEILQAMSGKDFNPLRTVYLEDERALKRTYNPDISSSNGSINVYNYSSNIFNLRTTNSGNSWLVCSEAYYPGWKATIDGNATSILRANYNFRAIFLPAGQHHVVFYYSPASFKIGALISFLTCIFVIFIFFRMYMAKYLLKALQ